MEILILNPYLIYLCIYSPSVLDDTFLTIVYYQIFLSFKSKYKKVIMILHYTPFEKYKTIH